MLVEAFASADGDLERGRGVSLSEASDSGQSHETGGQLSDVPLEAVVQRWHPEKPSGFVIGLRVALVTPRLFVGVVIPE